MDNMSAIATANTDHPTPKSKHLDVKYHFLKELITRKQVKLEYTPSQKNAADMLTKALKPAQYRHNISQLRLSPDTARGDCRMIKPSPHRAQQDSLSDDHPNITAYPITVH